MFDTNLLFTSAAAVTTSGYSSSVAINKTPSDGVWLEIAVTATTGTSQTLDAEVYESTDTTASTSADQKIATFPQITAAGRYFRHVQSKKAYLFMRYTIAGTSPSFTVTAGVVTGPLPDVGA